MKANWINAGPHLPGRKRARRAVLALSTVYFYILTVFLGACTTYNARTVGPTPIAMAQTEIPETQLLDVGLNVFTSPEIKVEETEEEGTDPRVRQSEDHFVPAHLRNTLQRSAQWGAVRMVPEKAASFDVQVDGEVLVSNGQELVVRVTVADATGRRWFSRTYRCEAEPTAYRELVPWQKDAFQPLYNTVANEMAAYRDKLTAADIHRIRQVAQLKFAHDFAPEAFAGYLEADGAGAVTVKRLPADDDPQMRRLLAIRARDQMYIDTLNQYYDGFYASMWTPYENWRKLDLTERLARAEVERSGYLRMAGGALLVALAIAMEVLSHGNSSGGASDLMSSNILKGVLVISGGKIFMDGVSIAKQAEMHSASIQELGESFGADMAPVNLELEGQAVELTGTAREQYHQWRDLLRRIYVEETGFPTPGATPEPAPQG